MRKMIGSVLVACAVLVSADLDGAERRDAAPREELVPIECDAPKIPFVVGASYVDELGAPDVRNVFICSSEDGQEARALVKLIDAEGFDLTPELHIAHGAIRRIYNYPVR